MATRFRRLDLVNIELRPRSRAVTTSAVAERGYCSRGETDHVSVLDCETFHKEQVGAEHERKLSRNLCHLI